jgi:hypothetical protein
VTDTVRRRAIEQGATAIDLRGFGAIITARRTAARVTTSAVVR